MMNSKQQNPTSSNVVYMVTELLGLSFMKRSAGSGLLLYMDTIIGLPELPTLIATKCTQGHEVRVTCNLYNPLITTGPTLQQRENCLIEI